MECISEIAREESLTDRLMVCWGWTPHVALFYVLYKGQTSGIKYKSVYSLEDLCVN